MKKLIMFISLLILCSCVSRNEKRTISWIKEAPKPIVCTLSGVGFNGAIYTLMDDSGNFFNTKPIHLNLPDTIYSPSHKIVIQPCK